MSKASKFGYCITAGIIVALTSYMIILSWDMEMHAIIDSGKTLEWEVFSTSVIFGGRNYVDIEIINGIVLYGDGLYTGHIIVPRGVIITAIEDTYLQLRPTFKGIPYNCMFHIYLLTMSIISMFLMIIDLEELLICKIRKLLLK